MEIEGETDTVQKDRSDMVLKEGQILDLVVIQPDEDKEIEVNEDETCALGHTSEQNDIAVNEENNSGCLDITGSLVGLTRKTIKDMHELYCRHARVLGFTVRKSTTRFSTHEVGVVIEKYFVCSCAGYKKSKSSHIDNSSSNIRKKEEGRATRTGCKASLRVKLNSEGIYEVAHHVIVHNHPLTRKERGHLHRFERMVTNEKSETTENMISSRMKATGSFCYMVHDSGEEECISHDHLNFVNHLKMNALEGRDAQTVIDMLSQQATEDEDFYFRVKLDATGRLCNVFWRDSMMKEDYQIYGDVVVFDTTCRTNRYNLICAPFVGINNHWRNVMFGCAFLADENAESFEWLFENFKKSMGGKCPITLFTGPDQTIANATEKVFPETRYRLCVWHLHQNVANQFGQLKGDNLFKDAFNKCLTGCADEMEFDSCWKSMISKFGLEDHAWFKRLYDLKEKWCIALSKDFFSAGILSPQRSENANNVSGFGANKTTSLTELYGIFKVAVKYWRNIEEDDEFQCSKSNPTSVLPLTGMLKHAAEVYTLTLFRDFEAEFIRCISSCSNVALVEDNMMAYDISLDGDECSHRVMFDRLSNLVTCSCKKFEQCGLLCYHSLRVLHVHSVSKIPERYILKRWTKLAKLELWDRLNRGIVMPGKPKDCIPWCHEMRRKYYNLILKCQENEQARRIIEDGFKRVSLAVDALMTSSNSTES